MHQLLAINSTFHLLIALWHVRKRIYSSSNFVFFPTSTFHSTAIFNGIFVEIGQTPNVKPQIVHYPNRPKCFLNEENSSHISTSGHILWPAFFFLIHLLDLHLPLHIQHPPPLFHQAQELLWWGPHSPVRIPRRWSCPTHHGHNCGQWITQLFQSLRKWKCRWIE